MLESSQNTIVRARIAPETKQRAEAILAVLGMNMSDAIRLFVTQISLRESFPLELKIPNATTLAALQADVLPQNYQNAAALFADVDNADD